MKTTAQKIAKQLGFVFTLTNDEGCQGSFCFPNDGYMLAMLCEAQDGSPRRENNGNPCFGGWRYTFADGSVIIGDANGWEIG